MTTLRPCAIVHTIARSIVVTPHNNVQRTVRPSLGAPRDQFRRRPHNMPSATRTFSLLFPNTDSWTGRTRGCTLVMNTPCWHTHRPLFGSKSRISSLAPSGRFPRNSRMPLARIGSYASVSYCFLNRSCRKPLAELCHLDRETCHRHSEHLCLPCCNRVDGRLPAVGATQRGIRQKGRALW